MRGVCNKRPALPKICICVESGCGFNMLNRTGCESYVNAAFTKSVYVVIATYRPERAKYVFT